MANLASSARELFRSALVDRVDRDHTESNSAVLRRRIVVGVSLVIGAVVLACSLSTDPGAVEFYYWTVGLAAVWLIGGFASGPLHLGRIQWRESLRRPILTPLAIGFGLGAVFLVGGLVVRLIPPLRDYTESVLAYARVGSLPLIVAVTLLNGIAEEVFFRGALFAAVGRRYPVAVTTVAYTIATLASGNPMLGFAAVLLGVVCGLQRRASGGILAPTITHCVWSVVILLGLPPIIG